MRLSSKRFDRLLSPERGGLGQKLAYRSSFLCPCRNPMTGQATYGCPTCSSKGVVWRAPVMAWAGILGQKAQRQWETYGQFEAGDQVVTIPSDSPMYAAGEYDRATMAETSEHFNQVLTRTGAETLSYPVASFEAVIWLDPVSKAIVTGALPVRPIDGGVLAWPEGGSPPMGVQYTLTGRRRQEFFVFRDLVQDRATNGAGLPRKVVMRRFELFKR